MVYVYLEGHSFEHEVFELIRLFFPDDDIEFIDTLEVYREEGYLIQNYLLRDNFDFKTFTNIYKDGEKLYSHLIPSINKIDIKKENIRKKIKNGIKKSIYNTLNEIRDVRVPWGVLTGIRPVKIVNELMDLGLEKKEIYRILKDEYMLFSEKASLAIDIANKERKYICPVSNNKFSLYVGIPFCPTRCLYCSFPSNSIKDVEDFIDDYTDKVIYEIKKVGDILDDKVIDTVYIGGGTPSSIPVKNLDRIINAIYLTFGMENINEFTVEAGRPDTIDIELLNMLNENNIRRISINPQTMNDKTLKIIGRNHTSFDIVHAFYLARDVGFENINMDLIVGLPGEGSKEIKKTMEEIYKLKPDSLTVHTLAIKRGSKFRETLDEYVLNNQSSIENMLDIAKEYANKIGLEPYYLYRQKQMLGNFENIGYSFPGKECIYNILMMEERQTIIAVGAGAVSKIYFPDENRIERVPNVKDLRGYLNRIDEMLERKKKMLT